MFVASLNESTFGFLVGCRHVDDAGLCVQDVVEEVPAAKDLFDQASEILGYDLLKLCVEGRTTIWCCRACLFASLGIIPSVDGSAPYFAGPKDKLDSTVISQPAIYVASLAAVEKLRQTEGEVWSAVTAFAMRSI